MNTITLPAHFDGEKICLDEPFDLKPNTKLIVTILPVKEKNDERDDWLRLSTNNLANAYGDDEPEYPSSPSGTFIFLYLGPPGSRQGLLTSTASRFIFD